MKNLQIIVDVDNGEVKLIIGHETLTIDKLLTDVEGNKVGIVTEPGQKQILKLLMKNILN